MKFFFFCFLLPKDLLRIAEVRAAPSTCILLVRRTPKKDPEPKLKVYALPDLLNSSFVAQQVVEIIYYEIRAKIITAEQIIGIK